MCRLLAGIMRTRRVLAPRMATMNQPRATLIYGKPPKDPIGAAETAFVLTVMTVTLLGPSGYILSQLDDYKAQD